MHQTLFLFLPLLALYLLSGCDLFNMSFLNLLEGKVWIICTATPLTLKNKITKIELKKIFLIHQKF